MQAMHESTARRCSSRPGVTAATLLSAAASAATAAAPSAGPQAADGGAWVFVTVAFLVVAVLGFAAGLWRGRASPMARDDARTPGTATPARDAGPPSAFHALADALAPDPRPVLLIESPAPGAPPVLARANAAALRLLGLRPEACGQAWASVEAAAPAALRQVLSEPAAGPWWLLHDPAGSARLALGPDGAAEDEAASLVCTVSHDLRAPIRVVEGFTRIVKEDYGPQLDRVGHDHLERVLAAGARMNQMIDAMLTMARLGSQPLARQSVDLSQTAEWVLEELARCAPERRVEVRIEPGLRARGDATLLRLVLENLLGNAWKYSAGTASARIEFLSAEIDGRRSFVVRDNGAGFDMRAADRLFGLFQRLHSAKDFAGTGVGLASVRRIVQRHGGQVWAEAAPGRGASFYFTLAE